MKVEEVGGEKLMMLNEEQQRPVLRAADCKGWSIFCEVFRDWEALM